MSALSWLFFGFLVLLLFGFVILLVFAFGHRFFDVFLGLILGLPLVHLVDEVFDGDAELHAHALYDFVLLLDGLVRRQVLDKFVVLPRNGEGLLEVRNFAFASLDHALQSFANLFVRVDFVHDEFFVLHELGGLLLNVFYVFGANPFYSALVILLLGVLFFLSDRLLNFQLLDLALSRLTSKFKVAK